MERWLTLYLVTWVALSRWNVISVGTLITDLHGRGGGSQVQLSVMLIYGIWKFIIISTSQFEGGREAVGVYSFLVPCNYGNVLSTPDFQTSPWRFCRGETGDELCGGGIRGTLCHGAVGWGEVGADQPAVRPSQRWRSAASVPSAWPSGCLVS